MNKELIFLINKKKVLQNKLFAADTLKYNGGVSKYFLNELVKINEKIKEIEIAIKKKATNEKSNNSTSVNKAI